MTTLTNVKLANITEVQKKHLKGKPLYVAIYEDASGAKVDVEIGLRIEPPELYKIGEMYNVETESKFGSHRVVSVAPVGGLTLVAGGVLVPTHTPKARTTGSYGKEFPVPTLHGDRSIIRQNSLAHATRLWVALLPGLEKPTPRKLAKNIIETASMFEEYSAGDNERRAAEERAASAASAANAAKDPA